MNKKFDFWIDIINPSHALFFNSLLKELSGTTNVTIRERAETVGLTNLFGIDGQIVGTDSTQRLIKPLKMIQRTISLVRASGEFDYAISFENGMSVSVSKFKGKKSIMFCDNDLKFYQKKSYVQDIETKMKAMADHLIIPKVCETAFSKMFTKSDILTYEGCKEDIYIADHIPDESQLEQLPFEEFVVVRPEALGSFYITEKSSILPELLTTLEKENINVVYLPRDKNDNIFSKYGKPLVPKHPINGLDLCYFSKAVATGSGTMAREAACMGKTSISFFPSNSLLSVDRSFVEQGKMLHSRDVDLIIDHILAKFYKKAESSYDRSKEIKRKLIKQFNGLL